MEPVVAPISKKSQSLKRPAALAHLDKIRSYEGECGADEEPLPAVKVDTTLTVYTKQDYDELKEEYERLAYHYRLREEMRILREQVHARAAAKAEKEKNELLVRLNEKDREIVALRQGGGGGRTRPPRAKKVNKNEPVQQPLEQRLRSETMIIHKQQQQHNNRNNQRAHNRNQLNKLQKRRRRPMRLPCSTNLMTMRARWRNGTKRTIRQPTKCLRLLRRVVRQTSASVYSILIAWLST